MLLGTKHIYKTKTRECTFKMEGKSHVASPCWALVSEHLAVLLEFKYWILLFSSANGAKEAYISANVEESLGA